MGHKNQEMIGAYVPIAMKEDLVKIAWAHKLTITELLIRIFMYLLQNREIIASAIHATAAAPAPAQKDVVQQ